MQFRKYIPQRHFQHILFLPIIYLMIAPLVVLDIFVEIYHRICFPLYGLPYVRRRSYIKIDRHRLSYLNWYEKINCAYCGYANGLLHYVSVIAAETERYWCGIKHQTDPNFIPPEHHKEFLPYGDGEAFREFVKKKN